MSPNDTHSARGFSGYRLSNYTKKSIYGKDPAFKQHSPEQKIRIDKFGQCLPVNEAIFAVERSEGQWQAKL
jgi:hypothetical protein